MSRGRGIGSGVLTVPWSDDEKGLACEITWKY